MPYEQVPKQNRPPRPLRPAAPPPASCRPDREGAVHAGAQAAETAGHAGLRLALEEIGRRRPFT